MFDQIKTLIDVILDIKIKKSAILFFATFLNFLKWSRKLSKYLSGNPSFLSRKQTGRLKTIEQVKVENNFIERLKVNVPHWNQKVSMTKLLLFLLDNIEQLPLTIIIKLS